MHVHFSIMSLWLWRGHISNENADFPGTCQSVSHRAVDSFQRCVYTPGNPGDIPVTTLDIHIMSPQWLLTWACNLQSHLRAGPPNSLYCRFYHNHTGVNALKQQAIVGQSKHWNPAATGAKEGHPITSLNVPVLHKVTPTVCRVTNCFFQDCPITGFENPTYPRNPQS